MEFWELEAACVERKRKRMVLDDVARKKKKKLGRLIFLTKIIPFSFLFLLKLAHQLKSLVQSHFKPESIIQSFVDYLFPNISKFDLINNETNSTVDNLTVLGILVDLVPDNNSY